MGLDKIFVFVLVAAFIVFVIYLSARSRKNELNAPPAVEEPPAPEESPVVKETAKYRKRKK